jgi:hypothetical protein
MHKLNEQEPLDDLNHSLTPFEPNQTLIAVQARLSQCLRPPHL